MARGWVEKVVGVGAQLWVVAALAFFVTLLGEMWMADPLAPDLGAVWAVQGEVARPFIFRGALPRLAGLIGEALQGPIIEEKLLTTTDWRRFRYAVFGLDGPIPLALQVLAGMHYLAWALGLFALWDGISTVCRAARVSTAGTWVVGATGAVVLFTPRLMEVYDPFVFAAAATIAALVARERWVALGILLALSPLVKESLVVLGALALPAALVPGRFRQVALPVGIGAVVAAILRLALTRSLSHYPGLDFEWHLDENLWPFVRAGGYAFQGMFAPLYVGGILLVGAFEKNRWDNAVRFGLLALQFVAIMTVGRIVEARTFLELYPVAFLGVAPLIHRGLAAFSGEGSSGSAPQRP